MTNRFARCLLAVTALAVATPASAPGQSATIVRGAPDSIADFAGLIRRLSDAGGFFNTDNLISNEQGYQQVLGAIDRLGVRGGAYIGVGPDQNFTYIARTRPRIAFIADIRRDNLLQHLMFKALFARSRNRAEFLALWTGRPVPSTIGQMGERSVQALLQWIDSTPVGATSAQRARAIVREEVQRSGVQLSPQDLATIGRFHDAFINEGLELRFTTTGRAPQPYYPSLRQLILEHDASGRMRGFLVDEEDFQFLKSMQRRNLIVPITGDLAGAQTLPGIGRYLAEIGSRVSVLYVSNVEDYLLQDGRFSAYAQWVRALPRTESAVMIRSYFGSGYGHPESTPEYYATQLLQSMRTFVTDTALLRPMRYRELVNRNWIPLRRP
ncbi:MAG: hypothetical protein ABMA00_08115 [Gemmatimonas sp.]